MRPLRQLLEAGTFRLLLAVARVLPRRVLLGLGGLAGELGCLLDRRHRRIGLANLRLAFPSLVPRDARRLLRATWRHFGRVTLDALWLHGRVERAAEPWYARVEGAERLEAAYAEGRGVLVFSAHYGHWELSALVQGLLGRPFTVVARPLDNPRLERLLAALRASSGNRVLHKRLAARVMLRVLRERGGVGIVIDQDARGDGVFVPFFGRPASTTPALALLALRTGAPVVPTYAVPEAGGGYRVVFEPPLHARPTGDLDADVARFTAACTAIVERWVRARPELWLWMHRRWKSVEH